MNSIGDDRKRQILECGVMLAKKIGYKRVSQIDIAKHLKISNALPIIYFGRITNLRAEILKVAIEREILEILAQAMGMKDPMVKNISTELKNKVINFILN